MNKFLRIIFYFLFLLIAFFNLNAQPTYLKRLSFNSDYPYTNPQDSIMHLLQFSQSTSGHSYIEIRTNRNYTTIMKLDLSGNIVWEKSGSWRGNYSNSGIRGLHSTPDNGIIYIYNYVYYNTPQYSESHITKLDSSGNLQWSAEVPAIQHPFGKEQEGYDVAILPNGYACIAIDSIFFFDQNGIVNGNLNFHGEGTLQGFANGDLFINSGPFRGRVDSGGSVLYSITHQVVNSDTSFYALTVDTIHHIDPFTGMYHSPIYYLPNFGNKIQILSDGGWIRYFPNSISRFDSIGNLLWINNLSLPTFGINLVGEQSNGTLLTGGTYISCNNYSYYDLDYSSFITTINHIGQSSADSVTQVTPGDANDDNRFDFGDALYVALAQGSVGPSRYDSVLSNDISGYLGGDIAKDFPRSFAIGVNHKQCDYNPNGIIDSLDLESTAYLGALYGRGASVPLRLQNPNQYSSNSLLPNFSWLPNKDSAITGDTVRFYFIIGDNGISVDSIFGIAFNLGWDSLETWDIAFGPWAYAINSGLGSLSDLRVLNPNFFGLRNSLLIARRDLQNAYFVQDTIGYADIIILDSTSGNIDLTLTLLSFKAITAGGFPIDFQFNTKPVHLRSIINSVPEAPETIFTMYPVPAKDQLILDQLPAEDFLIQIYNYEGKLGYSEYSRSASRVAINIENYSTGLYVILIRDAVKTVTIRKFVKE